MLRFLVIVSSSITLLATLLGHEQALLTPAQVPVQQVAVAVVPRPASTVAISEARAPLIGADDFARSARDSWPAALRGGEYTLLGPRVDFAAGAGVGTIRTPPGEGRAATLSAVNVRDVDLRVRIETDRLPEGGDQFAFLTVRRVDDATNYLARVRFDDNRGAWLQVARTVHATTQLLGTEVRVPDFTYEQGSGLWLRAAAAGQSPTALRLKAWPEGRPEPALWQYAASDDEPSLRSSGAVAIQTYVSARTTNAPVTFSFSDFSVAPAVPELLASAPVGPSGPKPQVAVAEAAPAPTPVAVAAIPTPVPTPTSGQIWQTLQPQLDAAWGSDTPQTVAVLDEFLARFPDDEVARDKLYAALVATGRDLVSEGDAAQAVDPLERARVLFPERAEAVDVLASLTPTPAPAVTRPAQPAPAAVRPVQPAPAPVVRPSTGGGTAASARPPTPTRPPAPAVVRPPVVQVAAPTPTKVPFVAVP
jgi:hypothetical protein